MTGTDGKTIEHPVKELTIGKAAIAGLMRQIVEEVEEAEKKVEDKNRKNLVFGIAHCRAYLLDIANGMVADQSKAKQLANMCSSLLGEEVDELDII